MTAKCQACLNNIGVIQNTKGTKDEPIGVCQNCSSLTCGHHGLREKSNARFICGECVRSLLAVSSGTTAGAGQTTLNKLATAYHLPEPISAGPPYTSLADFRENWTGFNDEFYREVERYSINFSALEGWGVYLYDRDRSHVATQMLVAAILIGRYLEMPPDPALMAAEEALQEPRY